MLLFISGVTEISAQQKIYHLFSGSLGLSLEGGSNLSYTDYSDGAFDYFMRSSIEYYLPLYTRSSFGFRMTGSLGYIAGEDPSRTPVNFRTDLVDASLSAIYLIYVEDAVFPYLSGGVSYLQFDPRSDAETRMPNNQAGKYKRNDILLNAELGLRFLMSDRITFNLFAGWRSARKDFLDDVAAKTNTDYYLSFGAGLTLSLFGDGDSDNDGVLDSRDKCPDTKPGVPVNPDGCPQDGDNDGIPDFMDNCPDTPEGVKVDRSGCPFDGDKDGVPDYLDVCPGTPKGIPVDENGCPKDSDFDGVPDYQDKCANTPEGVKVDKNGCPVDSDLDGVPDYLDKCAGTQYGTEVDANGCPKSAMKPKETIPEKPKKESGSETIPLTPASDAGTFILQATAAFKEGSAMLLDAGKIDLIEIIDAMTEDPLSRWQITGYTDSKGKPEANKKLSLERANSVKKYLVSRGVEEGRIKTKGMGQEKPIATNTTAEGRLLNRRIEIKRIN